MRHPRPACRAAVPHLALLPVALAMLVVFGAACSRPVVTPPAPIVEPPRVVPPVVVAPSRTRVASTVRDARYDMRSIARVSRDSAGRTIEQRVESHALVSVSMQRADNGDFRGSGRIDSFTVVGPAAAVDPAVRAPLPVALERMMFDAVLDAQSLRVVARPLLANECDRPESGAMSLVRDVLLRLPSSVAAGDRWADSSITLVCRSGVPMAVRTLNAYVIERLDERAGRLELRRTQTTRMEGKLVSPWRTLEVAGSGSATQTVSVDVARGVVQRMNGTSTMTLQMTDRSRSNAPRTQRVVQQAELRVESRP